MTAGNHTTTTIPTMTAALLSFAMGAVSAWTVQSLWNDHRTRKASSSATAIATATTKTTSSIITTTTANKASATDATTTKDKPKHAGAVLEGEDSSLFYGDIHELTTVTESARFLPKELYGAIVRETVVCCLDIVLVRWNALQQHKECLLVLRTSEPAKGYWWFPGGRICKGETFFAVATRKAQQETGITAVRPVQLLGVWNTFFPRSAWDHPTNDDQHETTNITTNTTTTTTTHPRGTQTVNPVVLVEILPVQNHVESLRLDSQSADARWISLDPQLVRGEDVYVQQALERLEAWDSQYKYRPILE